VTGKGIRCPSVVVVASGAMHRVLVILAFAAAVACGGNGAKSPADTSSDLDADPVALLPSSAFLLASVETKALFASPGVGSEVAALAAALLPMGPDAGFDAKRDVDRIVLGAYASAGVEVAAVVSGRFDPAKIAVAAEAHGGDAVVRGTYGGRVTYTVGPAMYCVLTQKTVVAGTVDGVRRLLERLHDKKVERAIPPWAEETLATPRADLALAADFTSQPLVAAALGSLPLPWLSGTHAVRVIGNFAPPGMNVAATLSYDDALQATNAADGVRTVDGWLKVVGPLLGGLSLQNLDVATDGKDMKCKFSLDEQTLGNLLAFASRLLQASR
jgi:hypothetical protein